MVFKDHNKISRNMVIGFWCLGVGTGLFLVGMLFGMLFGSGGFTVAAVGVLSGLIGGGLIVFSLLSGLKTEKTAHKTTVITQINDCRIVAKFAINGIGETIFDASMLADDDYKVKYYIRVQPQGGPQHELKANPEIWHTCSEGMKGVALVQGDWLNSFRAVIGSGSGDPYQAPMGNPYDR